MTNTEWSTPCRNMHGHIRTLTVQLRDHVIVVKTPQGGIAELSETEALLLASAVLEAIQHVHDTETST